MMQMKCTTKIQRCLYIMIQMHCNMHKCTKGKIYIC
jgi:hypothetical protein